MMLGARTGAWSGKALPYDEEVEDLESVPVGNESTMPLTYIDTGIKSKTPITVTVDCELVTLMRNSMIFGSRSSTDGRVQFGTSGNNGGTSAVDMSIGYGRVTNLNFLPTNGFHRYEIEFGQQTTVRYDDDLKLSEIRSLFSSDLTLWMFASNAFNGVYGAFSKMRISSFSVSTAGYLAFDSIPVRFSNENGVSEGAMYDRVSGKLFGNAGTGAFIIGPDKTT